MKILDMAVRAVQFSLGAPRESSRMGRFFDENRSGSIP